MVEAQEAGLAYSACKVFFGIKIRKPNERDIRVRENKRGKREEKERGREGSTEGTVFLANG